MEQEFSSKNFDITIRVSNGYIEFFKTQQVERHNEWLSSLEDWQINELGDDQKQCNNFYWIGVDDWVSDYKTTRQEEERTDNWHRHIKTKYWFTDEMYNWLNEMLLPKVEGLVNPNLRKQRLIDSYDKNSENDVCKD
jgi:hypothetical protein